jgi:AraC family transcriptional regulator of adaptative response/methylated-DNA-[protein]-cysteine methyltransferase
MAGAEQGPHPAGVAGRKDRRKNRVGAAARPWQNGRMDDYERIARVIRYLDAHRAEQPDLAALAAYAGLSPFHFHRLFSAWAGITPKDFLQCLTLAHAKDLLLKGESVLQAAVGAGLSGPGRLHDLCVSLEAASPGELKSGGAGWTIMAGFAASPFGRYLVGEGPRGICHLSFIEPGVETAALDNLRAEWPGARLRRDDAAAASLAAHIFDRGAHVGTRPALRACVRGTAFQVRVWRALLRIPPGALVSYGRLAAALGAPKAARAVGTAVGRNPLAYLVPCHRVIRETGVLGGYRWGAMRKQALLAWESGRAAEAGSVEGWAHEIGCLRPGVETGTAGVNPEIAVGTDL